MPASSDSRGAATPESAARTGQPPPAAEAPPITRDRRSSAQAFPWLTIVVGVAVGLVAVFADQGGSERLGTALAAVGLIGIGAIAISGVGGPITTALLGFAAAAVLTVTALSESGLGLIEGTLLGAAALTFLGSFGMLAASRDFAAGRGDEEPEPRVEAY